MANNRSAESKPDSACGRAHPADEPSLGQDNSSGSRNQPHLRIVYRTDCAREPSLEMPTQQPPRRSVRDGSTGMLDRTVQAQIGRMLRDVFADVAAEPVPPRFIKLLAALDAKEKQR